MFQCLCFLGYTAFLNLLSYLLRHRIIVTITAFFMLGVLYLYLTKISTALDMDYSLYKYWVVGLSRKLADQSLWGGFNTYLFDTVSISVFTNSHFALPVSKVGLARFGKAVMAT